MGIFRFCTEQERISTISGLADGIPGLGTTEHITNWEAGSVTRTKSVNTSKPPSTHFTNLSI
jgi:hypothetical protein